MHNISIILVCACAHRDCCFEAFVDVKIPRAGDDLLSSAAGKSRYVCTVQVVALRIAALADLQEKAPRGATCPGRRGKVFFVSSLDVRVLQSARFGYRQTEMKHNKFKTNKLAAAAASQDQSQKPQQEYVFSNLPVSGIQGQTEMKHTKFKTNKLTTAAWTKAENHKTSKKGLPWGGSDGVDHVAREVLQHGVANRGSPIEYQVYTSLCRHVCMCIWQLLIADYGSTG